MSTLTENLATPITSIFEMKILEIVNFNNTSVREKNVGNRSNSYKKFFSQKSVTIIFTSSSGETSKAHELTQSEYGQMRCGSNFKVWTRAKHSTLPARNCRERHINATSSMLNFNFFFSKSYSNNKSAKLVSDGHTYNAM